MTTKLDQGKLSGVSIKDVHEEFGEWFLKRGDGVTISQKEAGMYLRGLRRKMRGEDVEVTHSSLGSAISYARKRLEVEHEKTIIAIRKVGFKLATPREATTYGAFQFKKFLRSATRVERIKPLVKKQYLPEAIRIAFDRCEGKFEDLVKAGDPMLLAFQDLGKVKHENGQA